MIGFSGKVAAELAGITYRQLDYWARTDLIRPSLADAEGSGSRRRYTRDDVLSLTIVRSLLDAGIKLETIRLIFRDLRPHVVGSTGRLVIGHGRAVLARDDLELLDVLKSGQFVMTNLLSLEGVHSLVDCAIRERTERAEAVAAA